MATAVSIRPSVHRIVNSARIFNGANTALGAALATASSQACSFSSTPDYNNRRPRRDNNRLRGLSSIYRSGTRFRMNIDKAETPLPADYKPEIKVNPDHGLWDFFYAKDKLLLTPDESGEHGRGWTVEELRHKSWEDLHKLWWVCVKEQNRLGTARKERNRLRLPDGVEEAQVRLGEVRVTMRSIKHALTERWYLWEDARKLAEADPEIDLSNERSPLVLKDYFEEPEPVPERDNQVQLAEPTPSGFMAEEPRTARPEDTEPSTIPAKTPPAGQPLVKP
ncbi:putative 50S ribosomal protein l4 protein [Rosellinia necatrix]|uniref:Large ribosomal subunit protein uL29m n=1 Tax=Rosellinia necatrix TaxID=77044 RepID=A0A1W2TB29_ROSNE|nr:putative 50S ribosomal protein l4 protein [Rosellinia necatrix]